MKPTDDTNGLKILIDSNSLAIDTLNSLIGPSLFKRRNRWVSDLVNELELSAAKGYIDIEQLKEDERFVSAVMHGSQVAIRTHQEDKLVALKNALIHIARSESTNEDLHAIYLNFIDTLTPWHLKLLRFCQAPKEVARQRGYNSSGMTMGSIGLVIERTFGELGSTGFRDQLVRDLNASGLISLDVKMLSTTMTAEGAFSPSTTAMGNDFLGL